jgi:hypothetical protein
VGRQIIASIEVKCVNHEHGCNERMTLGRGFSTLANHLKVCKSHTIQCYQCDMIMPRGLLETHLIADCVFRWVTCQHCNRTMMSCQMDNHIIIAPSTSSSVDRHTHTNDNGNDGNNSIGIDVIKRSRVDKEMVPPFLLCKDLIICANGCSSTIPRQTVDEHDEMCPLSIIECSICKIKCTRSSIKHHMNDNTQQHMIMIMSTMNEEVASLKSANKKLRAQVNSLTDQFGRK